MTKILISDVSKLNGDISLYRDRVSDYRYKKALSYKNKNDSLLCIGAELLLANYLGRVPNYEIDEYGKPCGEEVEFNFSHSGNICVCAVSQYAVGVDVEKLRDINLDIARKRFCPKEYERIVNSQNPHETFFEYWVKKESYIKALGKGFKIPLNEFNTDEIKDWQFCMKNIEGYKLCVCTKDKPEF